MMVAKTAYALCAIALLAGCKAQEPANQANTVIPSAETQNTASAAPLTKDQALALMKEREHHMEAFGDETKKVGNALKASTPDVAAIQQSSAKINALAPKLLSWFPAGTGPEVGKTRAKAEIWQKAEDFALKAHDFETAANQFDVAAKSGDLSQINATFGALGKSCKACHDLYRAPKKD
ncbi:MAG TPA: cytochrome c [Sphingomicrobium sp.]|jgi:cytochrome c556|nr:cytochrome c [Sphingomicrobium sp.]